MHRNHVVNQVKNKYDEAGQQNISFLNFPQISKFFFVSMLDYLYVPIINIML